MGGYFYARMNGMTDLSVSAQEQPRGFASEDMACFALSAGVECFVLNADAKEREELGHLEAGQAALGWPLVFRRDVRAARFLFSMGTSGGNRWESIFWETLCCYVQCG